MFKNDEQLGTVCSTLLGRVGLGHLWTGKGPTEAAGKLLNQDDGALSDGERAMLLLAWALWDGAGTLTVADLVKRLDGPHLAAVGGLLISLSYGADGVDDWLAVQREERTGVVRDVEDDDDTEDDEADGSGLPS